MSLYDRVLNEAANIKLTPALVASLRADYLKLMRNTPRVKDEQTFSDFMGGAERFADHLDTLFGWRHHLERGTPLTRSLVYRQNFGALKAHEISGRMARAVRQMVYVLLGPPGRSARSQDVAAFQAGRDKWRSKTGRLAKKLWDTLKKATAAIEAGGASPELETATQGTAEIEGVRVVFDGVDDPPMELIRDGLRHYKNRVQRVWPWLWKNRIPLHIVRSGMTEGGEYIHSGPHIVINLNYFKRKRPVVLAATYAHEMGHHAFRFLGSKATMHWTAANQADEQKIPAETVLEMWPKEAETSAEWAKLAKQKGDQVVAIWAEILAYGPPGSRIRTRTGLYELIHEYKPPMEVVRLPAHPITAYGFSNSSEAFCEALGLLVAYGPRTLHNMTKRLLRDVIGSSLKVESMSLFDRVLTEAKNDDAAVDSVRGHILWVLERRRKAGDQVSVPIDMDDFMSYYDGDLTKRQVQSLVRRKAAELAKATGLKGLKLEKGYTRASSYDRTNLQNPAKAMLGGPTGRKRMPARIVWGKNA